MKTRKSDLDNFFGSVLNPLGILFGNERKKKVKKSEIMEQVADLEGLFHSVQDTVTQFRKELIEKIEACGVNAAIAIIEKFRKENNEKFEYIENKHREFRNSTEKSRDALSCELEAWKAVQERNLATSIDEINKKIHILTEEVKRIHWSKQEKD